MARDVAVVTGANTGLGYQVALHLARADYRVIMACRNQEKAQQAANALRLEVPAADITIGELDVSEPASIEAFAQWASFKFSHLDLLINNAGIAAIPLTRNSAGHELQLATNYLGAFALTHRLLPLLSLGIRPRVVNVSSLAHHVGKLGLDDFNWEETPYDAWQSYNRSKLAMLTFTLELERRLRVYDSNIAALCAHPGFAATAILDNSALTQPKGPIGRWLKRTIYKFVPTPAQGALPIIHAATNPSARGSGYYGPKGLFEMAGKQVGWATISRAAADPDEAQRLWTISEKMTGVKFLSMQDQPYNFSSRSA